jgi:hypothetical protein
MKLCLARKGRADDTVSWRAVNQASASRALGLAAVLAALALAAPAGGVGVVTSAPADSVEQRFALSVGPSRVALWSQVRLDGPGGTTGIVLPVTNGAAVDWGSRAFFESLEVATAPRILPPDGAPAVCPGDEPEPLVHVAGDVQGGPTLEPLDAQILDDAPAVTTWAGAHGLSLTPALQTVLQTSGSARFFVARFDAPPGVSLTKALRVVSPGGDAIFPLVLSQAGASPLRAVLWSVGPGRARLDGNVVTVDTSSLVFDVGNVTSNYDELLMEALGVQGSYVLEVSSHESLRDTLPATPGGPVIESVVRTYFERAADFGETARDPAACTVEAAVVLGQSAVVGTACPRSDLGVAGGGAPCAGDVVDPGEVSPDLLRCGALSDDLAILLSDLEPDEVWLTRSVILVPPGAVGSNLETDFPGGPRVDPIVGATSIDLSGCGDGTGGGGGSGPSGTGSGAGSGAGPGAGTGTPGGYVEVPVYAYDGCACGGEYVVVGYAEAAAEEAPEEGYFVDDDGCSGDTADAFEDDVYASDPPDDCGGETYAGSDSYYDDGCGCEASDADTIADDGCSCDGADSAGEVSDACSCDASAPSGDGCFDDCAVRPQRRPRPLNRVVYVALGLIVPLRRLSRPKRAAPRPEPTRPTR